MLHLDRMHSSAGCSTSYAVEDVPKQLFSRRARSRCLSSRCSAHPRPYQGPSSPERDVHQHRTAPRLHRTSSSLAVSAATIAPPSPASDGFPAPLPDEDLSSSIPDSVPSNLRDLHSRALELSRKRTRRSPYQRPDPDAESTLDDALLPPPADGPWSVELSPTPSSPSRTSQSRRSPEPDTDRLPRAPSPNLAPRPARWSRAEPRPRRSRAPASPPAVSAHTLLPASQPPRASSTSLTSSAPLPPPALPSRPRSSTHFSSSSSPSSPTSTMQLTLAIKAVTDWRQLPALLARLGTDPRGVCLEPFNAVALITHMAQLHGAEGAAGGAGGGLQALGPAAGAGAGPAVRPEDAALIEQLQDAVLDVLEADPGLASLRARQLSNAAWALARLGPSPRARAFLRDRLLPASYSLLPWYEPQHLSNTLWALAAAGVSPDDTWLEEYLTVAYTALGGGAYGSRAYGSGGARLQPQHLANVLWGLERLGVRPDEEWMAAMYDNLHGALPYANAIDLSSALSSLAAMGMAGHMPAATASVVDAMAGRLAQLLAPAPGPGQGPAAPAPPSSLHSSSTSARHQPQHLPHGPVSEPSDQSLSTSLWAVAVMGYLTPKQSQPPQIPQPPAQQRGKGHGSGAAAAAAAAAVSVAPSPGGVDALWEAAVGQLRSRLADPTRPAPGLAPAALTVALWAAAAGGRALPAAVTGLLWGRAGGAALAAFDPHNLATLVWAVAKAPAQQARPPPEWVADVVAAAGRQLPAMGPQAASTLLYSLCLLGARPPAPWMSALVNHFHRTAAGGPASPRASPQSLANVLYSLARMGYRLNEQGMSILAGLVTQRLEEWDGQGSGAREEAGAGARQVDSMSNTAPPPFSAQELSNVLWALATLGHAPEPRLGQLLLAATQATVRSASPQDLSTALWALAALRLRPPPAWLADYWEAATAALQQSSSSPSSPSSVSAYDLSQALYAAGKLRLLTYRAGADGGGLNEQQAADAAVHRAGGSGRKGAAAAAAASRQQQRGGRAGDSEARAEAAGQAWLGVCLAAAPRLLGGPGCGGQDLCNAGWGLLQLGVSEPPAELLRAFAGRLVALAPAAQPAQLALGVWTLGKWRGAAAALGPQQMRALEVATFRAVPSLRPPELAALLSGFAGLRHAPPAEWLEDAAGQVAARSREFGAQEWTMVLSSLSRLSAATGGSLAPHAEELLGGRLLPRLGRLPLPALVLLAYAAGCLGPSAVGRATVGRAMALLAAGQGGSAQAEGSGKGGSPADRPVCVGALSAAELSALMWAAVRVRLGRGGMPGAFREQFFTSTRPMVGELSAVHVASFLWAWGRLGGWPPADWRAALVRRCGEVAGEMGHRELTMAIKGMEWLRVIPSKALLSRLSDRLAALGPSLEPSLRADAGESLAVLARRAEASARLHRSLRWAGGAKGCSPWVARQRWVAWSRAGTPEAPAGRAARLSKRGALRLGVGRKRPARAGAGGKVGGKEAGGEGAEGR